MSDSWLRRIAWVLASYTVVVLIASAIWLFSAAEYSNLFWLEVQVRTITTIGVPIVGLIIIRQQPRHRLGWLWLLLGFFSSFRALGHAIYYGHGSQLAGYSALEYFLLWSTEATNLLVLLGQTLLLLWFPDGNLPSRSSRFLYIPMLLTIGYLSLGLFFPGPNWNGGEAAGGIVINNPFGWLPDYFLTKLPDLGFPAFLTFGLTTILAAVSLIYRYRSANRLVRFQIRWFVLGALLFVTLNFVPVLTLSNQKNLTNSSRIFFIIAYSNFVPLYLAVGLAILRYRLYDIDIIIRKTLQYTILSGILVSIYYGIIVLLQNLVENIAGARNPVIIVITTLGIAALFNPLRLRVQDFIDRRFYRRKYNAEQALAQFAATARDEVEMEKLTTALLRVVEETMQPASLSLWTSEFNAKSRKHKGARKE